MTKDEALKLALEVLELNNSEWKDLADSGDSGYWKAEDQDHYQQTNKAITAIKEALAQPEPVECDMDVLCIGCTPRNSDGSCPSQKPNGACNCYEKGFRDGSNEFKELYAAQPEQEPVAWGCSRFIEDDNGLQIGTDEPELAWGKFAPDDNGWWPLYTTPPKRPWVGLTDEEIESCANWRWMTTCRAIEAKLKEKNT